MQLDVFNVLDSRSSSLPNSNRKHFQSVLGFHYQSAFLKAGSDCCTLLLKTTEEDVKEATVTLAAASDTSMDATVAADFSKLGCTWIFQQALINAVCVMIRGCFANSLFGDVLLQLYCYTRVHLRVHTSVQLCSRPKFCFCTRVYHDSVTPVLTT